MLAEDLADILGEVPAVDEPSAVFADGQRAGGYSLGGIPDEEPLEGAAYGIDGGDLQVAPVDEAQVAGDAAVGCHLLGGATPHGVVCAFDYGVARAIREAHGAVFGVVLHSPDASGGFHQCLVAIGIEGGSELTHGGVLVEVVRRICGDGFDLSGRGAVADVVVGVAVAVAAKGGGAQLAALVVAEAVAARGLTTAGGAAGKRAPKCVVAVAALGDGGVAAFVAHPREQVALRFIALRQRHVVRHGERLQEIAAG